MSFPHSSHSLSGQYGRSMIEMLGVLSIVGILSFTGISLLNKTLTQYRHMKVIEQFNLILEETLYRKDFIKGGLFAKTKFIKYLGLLPNDWEIKSYFLYNRLGWVSFHNNLQVNFNMQATKGKNEDRRKFCHLLYHHVIIPRSSIISKAGVWQGNNHGKLWYGDTTCKSYLGCLSDITLADIDESCRDCETLDGCTMVIFFIPNR